MAKLFEHDCDECRYMGRFVSDSDEGAWDLYYCPRQILDGSIIARFGSSGPDYVSIPLKIYLTNADSVNHSALAECARRVSAYTLF